MRVNEIQRSVHITGNGLHFGLYFDLIQAKLPVLSYRLLSNLWPALTHKWQDRLLFLAIFPCQPFFFFFTLLGFFLGRLMRLEPSDTEKLPSSKSLSTSGSSSSLWHRNSERDRIENERNTWLHYSTLSIFWFKNELILNCKEKSKTGKQDNRVAQRVSYRGALPLAVEAP